MRILLIMTVAALVLPFSAGAREAPVDYPAALAGAKAKQRDILLLVDCPEISPDPAKLRAAFDAALVVTGRPGRPGVFQ